MLAWAAFDGHFTKLLQLLPIASADKLVALLCIAWLLTCELRTCNTTRACVGSP